MNAEFAKKLVMGELDLTKMTWTIRLKDEILHTYERVKITKNASVFLYPVSPPITFEFDGGGFPRLWCGEFCLHELVDEFSQTRRGLQIGDQVAINFDGRKSMLSFY